MGSGSQGPLRVEVPVLEVRVRPPWATRCVRGSPVRSPWGRSGMCDADADGAVLDLADEEEAVEAGALAGHLQLDETVRHQFQPALGGGAVRPLGQDQQQLPARLGVGGLDGGQGGGHLVDGIEVEEEVEGVHHHPVRVADLGVGPHEASQVVRVVVAPAGTGRFLGGAPLAGPALEDVPAAGPLHQVAGVEAALLAGSGSGRGAASPNASCCASIIASAKSVCRSCTSTLSNDQPEASTASSTSSRGSSVVK